MFRHSYVRLARIIHGHSYTQTSVSGGTRRSQQADERRFARLIMSAYYQKKEAGGQDLSRLDHRARRSTQGEGYHTCTLSTATKKRELLQDR